MKFLILGLTLLVSCKSSPSTVIFHSEMGKMTVRLWSGLPEEATVSLEQLLDIAIDSLEISQVLHDGFIQLNFQAKEALAPAKGQAGAAVSGAFVLSGGRFYLVQGREHTDATLDKWEQSTGRKIPPSFREQYKKKGGALSLEGRCFVLGTLVSGKEALDRIAALPTASNGQPLREIHVQLEQEQ